MPIVVVTHAPGIDEERLRRRAQTLPHAVSLAVECPEELYDGQLQPGDVEVRFHARAANTQERCDQRCSTLVAAAGTDSVGAYLLLPIAAWQQGG